MELSQLLVFISWIKFILAILYPKYRAQRSQVAALINVFNLTSTQMSGEGYWAAVGL